MCLVCVCVCTICMRIGRPLFIPFHIHWKDSLDDDDDDPEFSFLSSPNSTAKNLQKMFVVDVRIGIFFSFRFEKVGMLNTRKFVVCVCLCLCVVYPFILMFVFFLLWSFLFMYKWQQLTITFLFFSCFVQFCIRRNFYGFFVRKKIYLFVWFGFVFLCVCVVSIPLVIHWFFLVFFSCVCLKKLDVVNNEKKIRFFLSEIDSKYYYMNWCHVHI